MENYDNPLCWIDNYVKQLFDGIEYCVKGSYDALVQRLLSAKFSSTNNTSSEQSVQSTKDPVSKPTEEKPPKAEISKNAAPLHLSASSCPKANSSQSPDGYRDNDFILNAQIENGVLIKYKGTAKEIVIPDFITSIGRSAFADCNSLTSITIPDSVTNIGVRNFASCKALASITVDSNNKVYRSENNCIIVRKSNTLIAGCYNSVIPDSVTSIGEGAFEGCTSLASITIPDSVTSIGDGAFAGCKTLASIAVDINNKVYRSENNCIIERKSNTLIAGCYNSVIPKSVKKIGGEAFSGCVALASIIIPDSVTIIDDLAFDGCEKLTSIVIPDSVTEVGESAFDACSSLTTVYYTGSEAEWKQIEIGSWNNELLNAEIVFNYKGE